MPTKQRSIYLSLPIGILVIAFLWLIPWVDDFERFSVDRRFVMRASRAALNDIIIVGIDNESIASFDRPLSTWNPLHAELVQGLVVASPSCVFFDLIYDSRFDPVVRKMVADHLSQNGIQVPPRILNMLGFDTPFSKALIEAKQAGLPVIIGFFLQKDFHSAMSSLFHIFVSEKALINMKFDPDKGVRSCPLFAQDKKTGTIVPSVGLSVAAKLQHSSFAVASNGALLLGSKPIEQVNEDHEGLINFAGPQGTYRMIPFKDVLQDIRTNSPRLNEFSGKAVMVGFWDYSDLKNVPFGKMPGIEVHANVVENCLNNRFLQTFSRFQVLAIVLGLLFLELFAFARSLKAGMAFSLLAVILWTCLCWVAFQHSVVLPFAFPILFSLLFGGIESVRLFFRFDQESRKVKGLFKRYVNDSIIQTILENPAASLMQGKRGPICVMFVDIRSFTRFSESRDPQEVVHFLNLYFEAVTEIVLQHNGVVDKFLGDGVMAFFNAPIPQPSFIRDAVETALEIRECVKKSEIRSAAGSFDIKIGIGLHVGEALVGNIGSERKMEFTAIGDSVNTTSRIESLNKEYNSDIIASETVESETQNDYDWKYLGEVILRGKEKPVRLFSLLGKKTLTGEKGESV